MKPIKETINGVDVWRVNNDVNGNPRYIIHFLDIAPTYEEARKQANKHGGRVYRARWFGGGFIFQSYNIKEDLKYITELKQQG